MQTESEVLRIIEDALSLKGAASRMNAQSRLLGAIPELDSMAVLSIITTMEERFGITVEDDEIDGTVFETVGSLTAFVDRKLSS